MSAELSSWRTDTKSQTSASANGVVKAVQERLSENPNQGHRAPLQTVYIIEAGRVCAGPEDSVNTLLIEPRFDTAGAPSSYCTRALLP